MNRKTEPRQIERDAIEKLHDLLLRVPFLHVSRPIPGSRSDGELFPNDGFIKVRHKKSEVWLMLEVKSNAQLRDARSSVEYLLRFTQNLGSPSYPVFASQYLSPSIREFCAEKGVGYFDFHGNCRLVFDDVFIERTTASEAPERKRLKSIFSVKSSRVIRRLLNQPANSWKVKQLAEDSMVSAATVSLIKDKLLGEEYAARQGEAFVITNPEKLLADWAHHYDFHQHKQLQFYGQEEFREVEIRFAEYCRLNSIEYAFTMFSGAHRVAAFTRGVQRAYAYISSSHDLLEMASALKLKRVDSGGNFVLITPNDDDLLYGKHQVNGDFVVSDIQLYLDLSSNRGRGEENAEYLLEQRIRPRW